MARPKEWIHAGTYEDLTWYEQSSVTNGSDYAWHTPDDLPTNEKVWMECPVSGPGIATFDVRAWSAEYYSDNVRVNLRYPQEGEDEEFPAGRVEVVQAYNYNISGWYTYTISIPVGDLMLRFRYRRSYESADIYIDNVDVPYTDWQNLDNIQKDLIPLFHRVPFIFTNGDKCFLVTEEGNIVNEDNNTVYSGGDAIAVAYGRPENPYEPSSRELKILYETGQVPDESMNDGDIGLCIDGDDAYTYVLKDHTAVTYAPYDSTPEERRLPIAGSNNVAFCRKAGNHSLLWFNGCIQVSGSDMLRMCVKSDIIDTDTGHDICVALRKDGTVRYWGRYLTGQSHQMDDAYDYPEEISFDGGASKIIQVAAGNETAYGLREDGTVIGEGNNYNSDVENWTNIIYLVAESGGSNLIGIKSDGTAVATWRTLDWTNAKPRNIVTHLTEEEVEGTLASVSWEWLYYV